jgi:hypothetical protein
VHFTAERSCPDRAYTQLPTNLNYQAGGSPVYLCLLADNKPPFLTDVTVASGRGAIRTSCPTGTVSSIDLNLNTSSGNTVYACMAYTEAIWAAGIVKDVTISVGGSNQCPEDYSEVAGDLNDGVLGAPVIRLCLLSESRMLNYSMCSVEAAVWLLMQHQPWTRLVKPV